MSISSGRLPIAVTLSLHRQPLFAVVMGVVVVMVVTSVLFMVDRYAPRVLAGNSLPKIRLYRNTTMMIMTNSGGVVSGMILSGDVASCDGVVPRNVGQVLSSVIFDGGPYEAKH